MSCSRWEPSRGHRTNPKTGIAPRRADRTRSAARTDHVALLRCIRQPGFSVEGDTVTLQGQVIRPTLKSDAEGIVKQIEGVRKVKNEIEVLPLSPDDDRIRIAEYRAIYSQPVLNRYALRALPPIHIIVKNGNLTLEGSVATEEDKNIADIQANGVPGDFHVTNRLRIEP